MTDFSYLFRWLKPDAVLLTHSTETLPILELRGAFGIARLSPQGAHLMEFTPSNQPPLLFLSSKTFLSPGKAIRGGVPVIFPWFGPREGHSESPMHGLVRTRMWEIMELNVPDSGPALVRFQIESNAETLALWPHPFRLELEYRLGKELDVRWTVQNTGAAPFRFEKALHPYFPVSNVQSVRIIGLHGSEYIDKTDQMRMKADPDNFLEIKGETDRLYLNTEATLELLDIESASGIICEKSGSASSVVWNPWIAKAAALSDLDDEEWRRFVCIEQVNAARNALELAAGAEHILTAKYTRRSLEIGN